MKKELFLIAFTIGLLGAHARGMDNKDEKLSRAQKLAEENIQKARREAAAKHKAAHCNTSAPVSQHSASSSCSTSTIIPSENTSSNSNSSSSFDTSAPCIQTTRPATDKKIGNEKKALIEVIPGIKQLPKELWSIIINYAGTSAVFPRLWNELQRPQIIPLNFLCYITREDDMCEISKPETPYKQLLHKINNSHVELKNKMDGAIIPLPGHSGKILRKSFSNNGKFLTTTNNGDRVVRLWNAENGTLINTLAHNTEGLFTASFSPDNNFVITAGAYDGTAYIWETATGKLVKTLQGYTRDAVFSSDNTHIIAGEEPLVHPERPAFVMRNLPENEPYRTVLYHRAPFNMNTITQEQTILVWLLNKYAQRNSVTLQEIAQSESLDLEELKNTFSSFDNPTQKTLFGAYIITDAPGFTAKAIQKKPNNKVRLAIAGLCSLAFYAIYKQLTLHNK